MLPPDFAGQLGHLHIGLQVLRRHGQQEAIDVAHRRFSESSCVQSRRFAGTRGAFFNWHEWNVATRAFRRAGGTYLAFVSSIRIILYSLPLLGSAPNISIVFVPGPVTVSICRIDTGFLVSGQLQVKFQVSVLPSVDSSPSPLAMPVLWLSIQVETNFLATLS